MPTEYVYHPIHGTSVNDIRLVDFAKVDSMHYESHNYGTVIHSWDRTVHTYDGNDIILRDRPGDYKADAIVKGFSTQGHVLIDGGAGTDTVDYSLFAGSMEIDLRPLGEDVANTYTAGIKSHFSVASSGYAKATGLNGQTIYGQDFLKSIENVIGTDWNDKITGTDGANDIQG
ncbi:MAG: hypothetical protein KDJ77_08400, partial [Rhodobiaceae bacterium]|nr:hypothetical protein [Rhodobiaceae bacterium]